MYGVAYCPAAYQDDLDKLGFAGTSIYFPANSAPLMHWGERFEDAQCSYSIDIAEYTMLRS